MGPVANRDPFNARRPLVPNDGEMEQGVSGWLVRLERMGGGWWVVGQWLRKLVEGWVAGREGEREREGRRERDGWIGR